MEAILSSSFAIPLPFSYKSAVERDLTIKLHNIATGDITKFKAFYEKAGYMYIPRQYGLRFADKYGIEYDDRTSDGYPIPAKMVEIPLRDEYDQESFVSGIVEAREDLYDLIAKADTGTGKTVASLEVIRRLGRTACVVVDQENLKDQWVSEAKTHLGLTDDDIGCIQGDVCDYKGKSIVVAMVQTLFQRNFDTEVYDYFGTVVFDESHVVGAMRFSEALMLFPASFRFGVSATPDRSDGLQKVIESHLGFVEVELKYTHKLSAVRYVEYDGVLSWYANVSKYTGRYLQEIAEDTIRNNLIATIIIRLLASGRDVLAISDRIEQLEDIRCLLEFRGVDPSRLGHAAGRQTLWKYVKDPSPSCRPMYLEKDADYTPVRLCRFEKKTQIKHTKEAEETASVVFSTYSRFSKGTNVPRLSAGIDCTPRRAAKQTHGRILRIMEGKAMPLWVTIRDVNSYRADHQFLQRIDEYLKSNVEIFLWHPKKGAIKKDIALLKKEVRSNVKQLRGLEIRKAADGTNIILTPNTEKSKRSGQGKRTVKKTQKPLVSSVKGYGQTLQKRK